MNAAADELEVTSSALRWRLVALGELKHAAARALPEATLRHNGRAGADDAGPARFSEPFMEVMGLAINQGLVSVRRMSGLLDVTVDGLADLFAEHGFERPVEATAWRPSRSASTKRSRCGLTRGSGTTPGYCAGQTGPAFAVAFGSGFASDSCRWSGFSTTSATERGFP